MNSHILDDLYNEIKSSTQNPVDSNKLLEHLSILKKQKLNIMFVGCTGVGKSSTINAIFNTEIAKVGYSSEPETSTIQKFEMENMILWDTPGLGDNPQKDRIYAKEIANALKLTNENGELLIDLVVVLIDGSTRDMKTTYEIIENIVIPYIQDTSRIVIAINQCDVALKGRYWNYDKNQPDTQLTSFLDKKIISVQNRLTESTGITFTPIYYSALHHYNISKLLLTMMQNIPDTKRFLFTDSLNKDPEIWKENDKLKNYNTEIQKEVKSSLSKALDNAAKGAVAGATVGSLIPIIGPVVGATVGAVLGFLDGLVN